MIILYHGLPALTSNLLLLSSRQILGYRWFYYIALSETNQGASLVSLMKSCVARWNPSKLGWNLRRTASDEIKSVLSPREAGFHREAISSHVSGIYPDGGGFSWTKHTFVQQTTVCIFLVEHRGFEPLTPTLPVLCAPNCANAPHSTKVL